MENTYCVYMHILKMDGRKYIGITKQQPKRRWQNGKGYQRNIYFYRTIEKYSWDNFRHEVLFENLTKEQACVKEQALIKLFNTQDPKYGFNLTSGGEHYELPDYRKKYISYDDLYYQYITLGKSQPECAEYFRCSQSHIWETLRSYNIYKITNLENYNKKLNISKDDLWYQYVTLGKTIQACSEYFNCSSQGIYDYLDKYSIPVRKPVTYISYDDLKYAYIDLQLTIEECSLWFNCCRSTISKYLKAYEINNKFGITKENLYYQYIELNKSEEECAEYFKCTTRTLFTYRKKFNLKKHE